MAEEKHPMQRIRVEKITLNIGVGKEPAKLDKAVALIKHITGIEPVRTITRKRIPSWGLRPGLPIGCKLTLRKEKAVELMKRLLEARENKLRAAQFDALGNIAFGIPEYIDIPDVEYDPEIGVMGLEVCITLEKPGYRIKRRRLQRKKIGRKHLINREQAVDFMKTKFGVEIAA